MELLRNVVASRAPQAATLAAPSAQRPATSVALHNNQPLCICICDSVFVVDHDNVCLFVFGKYPVHWDLFATFATLHNH